MARRKNDESSTDQKHRSGLCGFRWLMWQTLFICLYNLHAIPVGRKNESKVFLYLFGDSLPAALAYSVLYRVFSAMLPALEMLAYAAGLYLVPMVMGYGLIRFQKKYVFTESKGENPK